MSEQNDDTYQPLRLKDLAIGERPQERLEKLGSSALSDTELLAMLLRSGSKGRNVLAVAQQLMTEAGSLASLIRWSDRDFSRLKGIGHIKALQLVAVMEISRRVLTQGGTVEPVLNRPDLVLLHFQSQIAALSVEKFWVLCLNRKNRLIKQVEITSGTATSSLAHPREVFREAIRQGATAIICVHNPSRRPRSQPSRHNRKTRQLRDASKTVDIELLDQVVGRAACDPRGVGYYSFRGAGLL